MELRIGGDRIFYHAGIFYRSADDSFVVVRAPIGARVKTLAPGYATLTIGGRRHFYVNETFFLWDDHATEYVVVEQPEGAEALVDSESEAYAVAELYIYPANGQTEEETGQDRYECHLWATDVVDYDPTASAHDGALYADYHRAMTACLEGRGYTVR